MANGSSLGSKSHDFAGNIQLAGYDYLDICDFVIRFKSFMDSRGADIWGCMVHDACLNEDGTIKNPHLHYFYHVKDKNSVRLSTELNTIAKNMHVNTLAVSIFVNGSYAGAFQYFTHQKYPEKHQYPKENILTNVTPNELDAYLAEDVKEMNYEYLIDVVARAYNKSDILRSIGLYYYRCYRGIINDLWNEFHEVREVRERKRNGKEKTA